MKLSRDGLMRLSSYLHMEKKVMLHFLRLTPKELPNSLLFQGQ